MGITDGYLEEDIVVFPNILRRMNQISVKCPVDDTHTHKFAIRVELNNGKIDDWGRVQRGTYTMPPASTKTPVDATHPVARYRMDKVPNQDVMVIETQGAISARDNWRAGTRDVGVAFFDDLLLREIDKQARGEEPMAVVHDPDQVIDTNLEAVHLVGAR